MGFGESTPAEVEAIARDVVARLAHELLKLGRHVERQVPLPIVYDGIVFEEGLRLVLLVDKLVVVENKSVERMIPVFEAQLLSHLRLVNLPWDW